jgi:hypothetical protein
VRPKSSALMMSRGGIEGCGDRVSRKRKPAAIFARQAYAET